MTPPPDDSQHDALLARIAVLEARVANGAASLDDYGELVRCRRALARREVGAAASGIPRPFPSEDSS